VVDLGGTRFWDCSCLHALVAFTRELEADGRAGRIVGALPATRRLIAMANLSGDLQLDGVPAGAAGVLASVARRPARRNRPASAAVTGDLVAAGHGR
jgi:anti-anti-sigma regulatory factor